MPRPSGARTPFPVPPIPIVRSFFILVVALLAAVPLDAQRAGDVPRRPRLDAAADTNDARAYYRLGQQRLDRRPDEAAAAFYWASQIDPGWADPLYGRHVALLMSEPRRLVRYWEGDRRTRTSAEVVAIDSLYFRALRIDPFVQRPFERELVRLVLMSVLGADAPGADAGLASFYTASMMHDMPPLLRARVMAGEGKAVQALQAFDEGLRDNRRRSETLRYIRHERGRLFGLIGNDSAALAELAGKSQARLVPFLETARRDGIVVRSVRFDVPSTDDHVVERHVARVRQTGHRGDDLRGRRLCPTP